MVARMGGYYGEVFKGFGGVTQGDPLSPTIFNVVVDAVVQHWVLLMAGGIGEPDRWGRKVIHCTILFYVDNGLVASTEPECIQFFF